MANILQEILADKHAHVAAKKLLTSLSSLEAVARQMEPPRGFSQHLADRAEFDYGLICEIKKASPSKGLIRNDFSPVSLAHDYVSGGATCLSVLTDRPYFQGQDKFLTAVHQAVGLPILRKDFMIDPYQVVEARALGADCILVIIAAVDDNLAGELMTTANEWDMDVLVEVHDAVEMERAAALSAKMIGINNRNLKTLSVNLDTTVELAGRAPDGALLVCESGLTSRVDLDRMAQANARCFLIGEHFMRQQNVTMAVREILEPRKSTGPGSNPGDIHGP